jgi:hypothetical protein
MKCRLHRGVQLSQELVFKIVYNLNQICEFLNIYV